MNEAADTTDRPGYSCITRKQKSRQAQVEEDRPEISTSPEPRGLGKVSDRRSCVGSAWVKGKSSCES